MKLHILPLAAGVLLLSTACEKTPLDRNNDDAPEYRSNVSEFIDLGPTHEYAGYLNTFLNNTELSDNVLSYQNSALAPDHLSGTLAATNQQMTNNGFDNFERSNVFQTRNNRIYYKVFKNNQNQYGNRDMCLAIFNGGDDGTGGNEPIMVIEGPPTVGMGLVTKVMAQTLTATRMEEVIVPIESIQAGLGSFTTSREFITSYRTTGGSVVIDYESDPLENSGRLHVRATGNFTGGGSYDIDHTYNVTY